MTTETGLVVDFLKDCADAISERASGAAQHHGAAAFQSALGTARPIHRDRTSVPAETCLADLPASDLADSFQRVAADISWIPSHRMTDGGTEAALAPIDTQVEFGDLTVGMLLLTPGGRYPEHSHPPHEIYLPIADGGQWRYGGDSSYRALAPGSLAYNHPDDVHGIVAGKKPLLALYVLWPNTSASAEQVAGPQ